MAATAASMPHDGNSVPVADAKQRQNSLPAQAFPKQNIPLPPGWIEMRDPSGRLMFFNGSTGQTSWERPVAQALPPGWQRAQTPNGQSIFIHTASGTVSYTPPTAPAQSTAPSQPLPVQRTVSVPQTGHVVRKQVVTKPQIARAMTAPVQAKHNTNSGVNVSVNMAVPLKAIPGAEQAYIVHQISENNNVQVLSKKLASDVAQTTTTAASLVTRQAKTVGKTMMSASKMQKASRKMIVHTGALGVKAGRACKEMVGDMVEAADGKGKYGVKKQRQYVPFNSPSAANTNVSVNVGPQIHSTPTTKPSVPSATGQVMTKPTGITAHGSINVHLNAGVPARKPLRKPVPAANAAQSTVQASNIAIQTPAQVQPGNADRNIAMNSLSGNNVGLTSTQVEELQAQQLSQLGANQNFPHSQSLIQPPQPLPEGQFSLQAGVQASTDITTSNASQNQTQANSQNSIQSPVQSQVQTSTASSGVPPPTYQQVVQSQSVAQPHTQQVQPQAVTTNAGHAGSVFSLQPATLFEVSSSTQDGIQHGQLGTQAMGNTSLQHTTPQPLIATSPSVIHTGGHGSSPSSQPIMSQHQQTVSVAHPLVQPNSAAAAVSSPNKIQFPIDPLTVLQPQYQTPVISSTYHSSPQTTSDQIVSQLATQIATSYFQPNSVSGVYRQQVMPTVEQVQPTTNPISPTSAATLDPTQLSYDQNLGDIYDYQLGMEQLSLASTNVQSGAYATTTQAAAIVDGGEILYSESTYVDPSSGTAFAAEEVVYVDENGNVLADQSAAAAMYVDESGDIVYDEQDSYVETDETECEVEEPSTDICVVEEVDEEIDVEDYDGFDIDF